MDRDALVSCRFWQFWHVWSKWSEPADHDVEIREYVNGAVVDATTWPLQRRQCEVCGMVEYRKVPIRSGPG